jgi:hypothetical protein
VSGNTAKTAGHTDMKGKHCIAILCASCTQSCGQSENSLTTCPKCGVKTTWDLPSVKILNNSTQESNNQVIALSKKATSPFYSGKTTFAPNSEQISENDNYTGGHVFYDNEKGKTVVFTPITRQGKLKVYRFNQCALFNSDTWRTIQTTVTPKHFTIPTAVLDKAINMSFAPKTFGADTINELTKYLLSSFTNHGIPTELVHYVVQIVINKQLSINLSLLEIKESLQFKMLASVYKGEMTSKKTNVFRKTLLEHEFNRFDLAAIDNTDITDEHGTISFKIFGGLGLRAEH